MIGFDSTTLVFILAIALGGLGMKRGVRTEGITLAGVLGAVIVLGSDGMGDRLIRTINKLPRIFDMLLAPDTTVAAASNSASGLLKTADEKLVFAVVFFAISVALFYFIGSKYGGSPAGRSERLIGGLMGGVSGFAIGLTAMGFSQNYLSRHPNAGGMTVTLPSIQAPSLPAGTTMFQYAPLVLLIAVGVVAVLAITSFWKARQ